MQDTIWANDGETMVARICDLPWVTLSSGRRTSDTATEYANARLIAAAPDLLAVLQALASAVFAHNQKCTNLGDCIIPELSDAKQAIARATNPNA